MRPQQIINVRNPPGPLLSEVRKLSSGKQESFLRSCVRLDPGQDQPQSHLAVQLPLHHSRIQRETYAWFWKWVWVLGEHRQDIKCHEFESIECLWVTLRTLVHLQGPPMLMIPRQTSVGSSWVFSLKKKKSVGFFLIDFRERGRKRER